MEELSTPCLFDIINAKDKDKSMENIKLYLTKILVVAVVAAGGLAYYFYDQAAAIKKDPNKIAREETANLVAQVGKLIVLPEGETPTVATVSDPEKLKDQPFFSKAKTGDKVLIYTNAKKALLYDVENKKIVEVAPINIGAPAASRTKPAESEE